MLAFVMPGVFTLPTQKVATTIRLPVVLDFFLLAVFLMIQNAICSCLSCGEVGLEPVLSLGTTPLANVFAQKMSA